MARQAVKYMAMPDTHTKAASKHRIANFNGFERNINRGVVEPETIPQMEASLRTKNNEKLLSVNISGPEDRDDTGTYSDKPDTYSMDVVFKVKKSNPIYSKSGQFSAKDFGLALKDDGSLQFKSAYSYERDYDIADPRYAKISMGNESRLTASYSRPRDYNTQAGLSPKTAQYKELELTHHYSIKTATDNFAEDLEGGGGQLREDIAARYEQ